MPQPEEPGTPRAAGAAPRGARRGLDASTPVPAGRRRRSTLPPHQALPELLSPEPVLDSRVVQWLAGPSGAETDGHRGRLARMVVATSLLISALASSMAAMAWLIAGGPTRSFVVLVVGTLVLLCAPMLLRLTGRVRLSASWVCVDLVATVGLLVLANGGIQAPAALWLIPIPLVAAVLLGPRAALATAILACLEVLGVYAAGRAGQLPAPDFTPSALPLWLLAALVGTTVFVALLATLLEWQDQRTRELLVGRNREIAEIVERIPEGIAIVRLGIVLYANRALAELLGVGLDDLAGQSLLQWVAPEHRGALAAELRKESGDEKRWPGVRLVRRDGTAISVELVPGPRLAFRGQDVQVLVCRDRSAEEGVRALREQRNRDLQHLQSLLEQEIAARREAQQEAWIAAGEIHGLFEGTHDAILIFDPAGETILDANEQAAALYGMAREQLVGRSLVDLSVDPDRGRMHIERVAGEPGFHRLRSVHRRLDGSVLHVDIIASVIDYRGRTAILSNHRDITEQVRAEEELARAEVALEAGRAKSPGRRELDVS